MTNELHTFIKESLEKGIDRARILNTLIQAGWQEDEVKKALAAFADLDFPIPVPRKKPSLQAREAFLYLVSFITLYITAFSFGALVFQFITIWFPDSLQPSYQDSSLSGMRMAIASLIIAFPLYVFLMRVLKKLTQQDPSRRESGVRKWLTYLTLVVAAGIIIGDFIAIVFHLLGGELPMRFILKALTVLIITGSIFGYYLSDLQKEEKEPV